MLRDGGSTEYSSLFDLPKGYLAQNKMQVNVISFPKSMELWEYCCAGQGSKLEDIWRFASGLTPAGPREGVMDNLGAG